MHVILLLCFWMEDFLIAWYFWYGGVGKEMAWQQIMIDTEQRHKSISFSMSSIVFVTYYYIHKDSFWHSTTLHYFSEYLKLRILLLNEWNTIYYLQFFFRQEISKSEILLLSRPGGRWERDWRQFRTANGSAKLGSL